MQKKIMLLVCITLVLLLVLAPTIAFAGERNGNGPVYENSDWNDNGPDNNHGDGPIYHGAGPRHQRCAPYGVCPGIP